MNEQQPAGSPFELRLGGGGKGDPLILRSPVIAASGCFPLRAKRWTAIDVAPLGAVCTPSVAMRTRPGGGRFALDEAPAGLLLRGGYPTVSARRVRDEIGPHWPSHAVPLIATVQASDPDECWTVVAALAEADAIAAIELSLPERGPGGSPADTTKHLRLIERVHQHWPGAVIAKLPPALAATTALPEQLASAGVDALSLGGGFSAISSGRADERAGGRLGRLVGPATRPLALRQLAAVARTSRLPVIASGGIATADDALAFLAEGAVAVQVGSIALRAPLAAVEIARAVAEKLVGAGPPTEPGPRAATVIG